MHPIFEQLLAPFTGPQLTYEDYYGKIRDLPTYDCDEQRELSKAISNSGLSKEEIAKLHNIQWHWIEGDWFQEGE